jgi:GNAT superfamily N-acetyltransferase
MSLIYRPAQPADLELAEELTVNSINDLTTRHGFAPMATPSPPVFQLFSLRDDPDGLWVAEEAGQMLGFAFSWVCGDFWFLAQLFVAPDRQGAGIGNELIARTFEQARKAGAANKALITFAFNTVSQGLYIRHGLYPRFPIYVVSAARQRVKDRLQAVQLGCASIGTAPVDLEKLARIDRAALGVSREKHHKYLIDENIARGVFLNAGDHCVGYAYINADGHIGPLAVLQPENLGAAFATALRLAADGNSERVSAFLPGTCDAALAVALGQGMRIAFPMLMMSSKSAGDWTRYLPRNPGFM